MRLTPEQEKLFNDRTGRPGIINWWFWPRSGGLVRIPFVIDGAFSEYFCFKLRLIVLKVSLDVGSIG